MVTSDFRRKVEIWPYRAGAMENMQYIPYLMAESPKFFIGTKLFDGCGHG